MAEFPQVLFRGNSAYSELEVWLGDEKYTFNTGDKVRLGIKRYVSDKNYIIQKDFDITTSQEVVLIQLTPEETKRIKPCNGICEIAIQYNHNEDYKTIYQEPIALKEVVINVED